MSGDGAPLERNLGEQPLQKLLATHGLKSHDLVVASSDPITHKMVTRGCKGRRLTKRAQLKVLSALNRASGESYTLNDLFNY